MRLFSKPPKRLVRIHHEAIEDKALDGIWLGMVDGHYHLTAVKLVDTTVSTPIPGDVFVPQAKVLFLETLASDTRK